jgi:hypothetical protein
MTEPAYRAEFPDRAEREALNAALLAAGAETGFWDDYGRPRMARRHRRMGTRYRQVRP